MNRKLAQAQNIIAQTMADKIAPLFTGEMRLTFIARSTENPECYLILTDEKNVDLPRVVDTVNRHSEGLKK